VRGHENRLRDQPPSASRQSGGQAGRGEHRYPAASAKLRIPSGARAAALQTQIYHHALATGFSRGYLVSAGVMVLAVIIALAVIRIRRQDMVGADPTSEPARVPTSPARPPRTT
jgi:hypothetical protein